jgi:hypothetical protein
VTRHPKRERGGATCLEAKLSRQCRPAWCDAAELVARRIAETAGADHDGERDES